MRIIDPSKRTMGSHTLQSEHTHFEIVVVLSAPTRQRNSPDAYDLLRDKVKEILEDPSSLDMPKIRKRRSEDRRTVC